MLKRQGELTKRLAEAARVYYDGNAELMSNLEYDRLYDELLAMEEESGTVFTGSPTRRVGYEVSTELVKQVHAVPMLSLNKTKDVHELAAWLGEQTGLLSYKLDGLTVALTYEGGELSGAVTRGNGEVGEVVTAGARTFANLPLKISYEGKLVLRGEAVILYSDFEKINREIGDADARYKNPRNLVSGSVRQLDSSVTAGRRVRFFAFSLVEGGNETGWDSRLAQMDFLRDLGFETVEYEPVTADGLSGLIEKMSGKAASQGFDTPADGLVLEYDDIVYSESLGATSKFPRDAMAFKWQDEEAETELLEIEWSASRTGLINPIAIFRPVELEGTTVSRASLHNVSILEDLELGLGDRILVYKANMIIPQVSENLTRSGAEKPPARCPVCGIETELKDADGVKTLLCVNGDCPAKKIKAFAHFVSRPCMNIEGMSEQTLEKFVAAGLLHELADVFRIASHREVIVNMEGFGEKSFEKLSAAVEKARATTAGRLLAALGVPEVGTATAKMIARSLGNDWDRMKDAGTEELSGIEGVGPVIARLYTEWFSEPKNTAAADAVVSEVRFADPPATQAPISAISGDGTFDRDSIKSTVPVIGPSPLTGKTFVITGSLTGYKSREDLKERIEALGGKVSSSVSSKTDFLINNDAASPSAKNKTALSLGVKIITEAEFETLAAG